MSTEHVYHGFAPVFNEHSVVLILGTMPSPKSREHGFYYSHPQNRFWGVLASLFGEEKPVANEEKEAFCLRHGIALWDVLAECDINNASDSSIKNPIPNDIPALLEKANIRRIYTTGTAAAKLFARFFPELSEMVSALPSTSPANAKMSKDALAEKYSAVLAFL